MINLISLNEIARENGMNFLGFFKSKRSSDARTVQSHINFAWEVKIKPQTTERLQLSIFKYFKITASTQTAFNWAPLKSSVHRDNSS